MRVVLNTNVWISGVFWKGVPSKILDFFEEGKFRAVFSEATFKEWLCVVKEKVKELETEETALRYSRLTRKYGIWVEPEERVTICRDPRDNKFLEAAVVSNAEFLITGDKDLLSLKKFRKTKIIPPKKFLLILKKEASEVEESP